MANKRPDAHTPETQNSQPGFFNARTTSDEPVRIPFQYQLFERKTMIVISMKGTLGPHEVPQLGQCQKDLKKFTLNRAILDFQQVQDVENEAIQSLHQFNEWLRDRPTTLRFCHLHPKLADALTQERVIQAGELRTSLEDAMKNMSFRIVKNGDRED